MNVVEAALAGPQSRIKPGVWIVNLMDKTRLQGQVTKTNYDSVYAIVDVDSRYKYFHADKVACMFAV